MIDDPTAILDAIRRIVQALRASAAAAEREVGISGAQLFVLRALAVEGALTPGELAARTATHPSSISVVVAKLVAAGLARRAADPDDGRRVALSATARGRALLDGAPAPEQERLLAAIRRLTAPRRRFLADALGELVRAMGLGEDEAPTMFFEREAMGSAPRGVADAARREARGSRDGASLGSRTGSRARATSAAERDAPDRPRASGARDDPRTGRATTRRRSDPRR